jgi:hypothetical protein
MRSFSSLGISGTCPEFPWLDGGCFDHIFESLGGYLYCMSDFECYGCMWAAVCFVEQDIQEQYIYFLSILHYTAIEALNATVVPPGGRAQGCMQVRAKDFRRRDPDLLTTAAFIRS